MNIQKTKVSALLSVISIVNIICLNYAFALDAEEIKVKAKDGLFQKIRIFDFDKNFALDNQLLASGIMLSAGYRAKQSTLVGNIYTTVDQWKVSTAIPISTSILKDLPIGISLSAGAEIFFARNAVCDGTSDNNPNKSLDDYTQSERMKNIAECRSKNRVGIAHPLDAPWDSDKADRLEVGDFVAIKSNMGIGVSAGVGVPLLESIAKFNGSLNASIGVGINGDYQVHFFKVSQSKLRVRFVTASIKSAYMGIFSNTQFNSSNKIEGKVFNTAADKLNWNYVPFNFSASNNNQNVVLADYIVDLSNDKARKAYDGVISINRIAKELRSLIKDNKSSPDDVEFTPLLEWDNLAKEEQFNNNNPAIKRLFIGKFTGHNAGAVIGLGLNLIRFDASSTVSNDTVMSILEDGTVERYSIDSINNFKSFKTLFGTNGGDHNLSGSILLKLNENYLPVKMVSLNLSRVSNYKHLTSEHMNNLGARIRSIFPESIGHAILGQIDSWSMPWKMDDEGKLLNVRYVNNISFNSSVMDYINKNLIPKIPHIVDAVSHEHFKTFSIGSYPALKNPGTYNCQLNTESGTFPSSGPEDCFDNDKKEISEKLKSALDRKNMEDPAANLKRKNDFLDLASIPLFQYIGADLLFELINQNEANKGVRVRFSLSAADQKTIEIDQGDKIHDIYYDSAQYILNVLTNRRFDSDQKSVIAPLFNGDGSVNTKVLTSELPI